LVTNHEQGRVNLLSLPKNIQAYSGFIITLAGNCFNQKILEIFQHREPWPGKKARGPPGSQPKHDFRAARLL